MKKLMQQVSELEQRLNNPVSTEDLEAKLQLAKWYNYIDSGKSLVYSNQIIDELAGRPTSETVIQAHITAAIALLSNRKVTEAVALVQKAEDMAHAMPSAHLIALAGTYSLMLCPYNNAERGQKLIGELEHNAAIENDLALKCQYHQSASDFLRESDLPQAGVHLFEALGISKLMGQPWMEGLILCKLGMLADRRQDLDTAERFYHDALPLFVSHGCTQYIYQVYICMSKLMITRKEHEHAIEYAEQAYNEAASINFKSAMDFALMHKATALMWLKRLDEAEPIVLSLLQNGTDKNVNGSLLNMLSNMYVQRDEVGKAIDYAKQSYDLRKDMIRPADEMVHHEKMYKLHVRVGDYKEALKYFELFHNRKLLTVNENSMATLAEMQAKYDSEKREAELRETKLQQAESELKALKAQMNPHFIFNSLNSIQEVFFLGDKQLANEHLSRFSQLMRNILKASGKRLITLLEEIQMLEEYLALEALRFGEAFSYHINSDENVDVYTLEVPPMIIQPFVENAVKHGLHHKTGEQRLIIHFSFDTDKEVLTAVVSDNGIGRKASEIINRKRVAHHSFATSATSKRFEMLNSNAKQKFGYHYTDAQDSDGNATGTHVHITIPIEA